MCPFGLVVAFDTAHPEQSVPGRLRSLLGFWNRPSAQQNGLNKQRAAAAGPSWPDKWRHSRMSGLHAGLRSAVQRCSQRPQRQSARQTLRSLIPTLPCALALALALFSLHQYISFLRNKVRTDCPSVSNHLNQVFSLSDSQQKKEPTAHSYAVKCINKICNLQKNLQTGPCCIQNRSSTKTTFGLHKSLDAFIHEMEKNGDTYPTRLRPLSLCFVYCFGQRDTLCLWAFFPFIAPQHEDFATQRSSVTLGHIDMQEEFHSYLDGATPTRFGPRPRKSDRGPSFSKIDLQHKGRFFIYLFFFNTQTFVCTISECVGWQVSHQDP